MNFDELIQRLRSEVVMKKLRIKEYFRDIDKLRKGYCSSDQFRRILQLTGIMITDHQMFLLYDRYNLGDGRVNYKKFTEDID
jgi:Ca2+-binding EF-hand superfamily protein